MEYYLDNRVVFSTEREHKSLYSWSIKEFDESGKQIGGDQIPWEWSLSFEAIELNRLLEISKDKDRIFDNEESRSSKVKISEEHISGRLLPLEESREAYSMFGTQCQIETFALSIHRATDVEKEGCRLWGSVSFALGDYDFECEPAPDSITVFIFLSTEKYDHVMHFMKSGMATSVVVCLSGVSGFYSDWSPSVTTNSIKVLANRNDQKLENPQNLEFDPPTLGDVQGFNISLRQDLRK